MTRLVAILRTVTGTASEPLVVDNFSPPGDSLRIAVSAVGWSPTARP